MDLKNASTFRIGACDLNGQMRGKRVPISYLEKLDSGALQLSWKAFEFLL